MYAVGAVEIDSVLMIIALSTEMETAHKLIVGTQMMRGFADCCALAQTRCRGGQTILNPWPLIGGCASTAVRDTSLIPANKAQPGDILILTKPLGSQIAGNLAVWMLREDKWSVVISRLDAETCARAVKIAEINMMRLNLNAARASKNFGAHGTTDITGFGILGHAENLASIQEAAVDLEISSLPVIRGLAKLERDITVDYKLTRGLSAETSGGLLIILPPENLEIFRAFMENVGEGEFWIVGGVKEGSRVARVVSDVEIIEV